MEYVLITVIVGLVAYIIYDKKDRLALEVSNTTANNTARQMYKDMLDLQDSLGVEREKNRTLLSQKKSSETRLGQISEHLVPFLENCPYNPKDLHFLGNPIDYLAFDFDEGKIIFLEIKSGNSQPSKRQKLIKNLIKTGRVFYDEIRINEKGVKHKKITNDGPQVAGAIDDRKD